MRIGLTGIFVEDQDQAERFYTQMLGFQVHPSARYGPEGRWLTVVAPEDPDGCNWCCIWPTRRRGRSRPPTARPVLSLATDDCQGDAERLKAKGVVFVKDP